MRLENLIDDLAIAEAVLLNKDKTPAAAFYEGLRDNSKWPALMRAGLQTKITTENRFIPTINVIQNLSPSSYKFISICINHAHNKISDPNISWPDFECGKMTIYESYTLRFFLECFINKIYQHLTQLYNLRPNHKKRLNPGS